MNRESYNFLKTLMRQPSPSGFEIPAQKVVRQRMKSFADRVTTDVLGNVIGILNEKAAMKIMLTGHVDEIGLMITHVDDNGYLYFAFIGGCDPAVLISQRVCILTSKGIVRGVVGRKSILMMETAERGREIKQEDLWIDIGAKDKKDALKAVAVGDPIVIAPDFIELRNGLVSSRAFDDRAGAWVVTEVLRALARKKIKVAVYAVSTVQEEIGARGVYPGSYAIKPDVGIAVDGWFTSDCPTGEPKKTGEIALGKGPILHIGADINPVLGKILFKMAGKKGIKYQIRGGPLTPNEASGIQLTRGGCASASVSIPMRYIHTSVEVVSLNDLDAAVSLITETILAMSGRENFIPG